MFNYFLQYKSNEVQLKDFVYVKLIFYYLYCSIEEFKTVESIEFESFTTVYNHYYTMYPGLYPLDYYRELPFMVNNDEFEKNFNYKDKIISGDWEELAGQLF